MDEQANTDGISGPAKKRALIFIYTSLFLDMMGASLLLPIVPYIIQQYNSDALTVGLLSMVYSACAFLTAPALGKLSDRWGRRPLLLAAVLGSAVSYTLFGLGGALWVLFAARILDGLTTGNISTAMAYLADLSRPEERARYFAFAGVAFGVGFTLGPVIAGVLVNLSLSAPAFAAGLLSLLAFVFGFFFLPESLPPEKRSREPFRLADANPFSIMAEVGRLPNLAVLFAAYFTLYLAYGGLFPYISVYTMQRFSATAGQTAFLLALVGLSQMIGQGGMVYRLTPRFGEKKIAIIGAALQALAYPLIALAPSFWMLYPLGIVSAIGNAFTRPTLDALAANSVAASQQGRVAGVTSALNSLTNVAGPLLAGLAYEWISPGSLFIAGGVLIAAAGGLVARVRAR